MTHSSISLRAVYSPLDLYVSPAGGQLLGESPTSWCVTVDGATVEFIEFDDAIRYFLLCAHRRTRMVKSEKQESGDLKGLRTHHHSLCKGEFCSVHNPSPHHMREWPRLWRYDRGLMERICPHGIGHPDPDHLDHVRRLRGDKAAVTESVHGCDGCCAPPKPPLPK